MSAGHWDNDCDEEQSERIGKYSILHSVGRGSFGDVKCAKVEGGDTLYALKICSKSQLKKIKLCEYDLSGSLLRYTGVQRFERECAILKSIVHANIVTFCEVFEDEEEDLLVLVTDYTPLGPVMHFDSTTQRYVYNPALVALHEGVFEVEDVLRLFRDLVEAVSYLHQHNICHRDIKPANILLSPHTHHTNTTSTGPTTHTNTYKLVLCDFGSAEQFHPHDNPAALVSNTVGSPADWAPEAVFPEKYDPDVGLDFGSEISDKINTLEVNDSEISGPKVHRFSAYGVDVWCMGVVLYELFYLEHPFYRAELSEVELYERIDSHDPLMYTTQDAYTSVVHTDDSNLQTHHSIQLIHTTPHTTNTTNTATTNTTCTNTTTLNTSSVKVHTPDQECTAVLEGLLQKEPTMRWSVDTLLDMSVFV